ncbi:MAG: RNA polymerase sigma factor [Verrucomicrobia bacterium]|nr:RNA polymerase sigma factor [Verrucomicrobiota bacterium]
MMTTEAMAGTEATDAGLVAESLAGDRDAFGRIVARYQSLICSLAFSATGSLSQSEDLAQETFVAAWKQLRDLREPPKLRSWLCGIARHRISDVLRQQGREPSHAAEPLETARESPALEPLPPDYAISKEEEAILWRSVERIPEIYREPLILFYREHQSIERVAEALDLSEDAVKQRLSRGRKLLHAQVLAFVEGALERTNPGKAFTIGVLAALPVMATSASAATIGAAAAKGGATATSATIGSVFNALLGPLIGLLGAYLGVRASIESTRTPRERQFAVRMAKITVAGVVVCNVVLFAYIYGAVRYWEQYPVLFAVLGIGILLCLVTFILVLVFHYNRQFRRIRDDERQRHLELFRDENPPAAFRFTEYRSRRTFLGLPLIHIRSGAPAGEKVQPAVGWIAIGDRAVGILFAAGGVALGGAAAGVLAVGGVAVGGLAIGGAAVGLVAAGGFAAGWFGAEGGLAIAREFALGGRALAQHANDQLARDFFARYRWLDVRRQGVGNLLVTVCWLPMLLVGWQALRARREAKGAGRK